MPSKSTLKPRTAIRGQKTTTDTATVAQRASAGHRRKYGNNPVEVGGFLFDSQAEGARYMGLYVAQQMGEIRDLTHHERFPLFVHGQDCGYYEADFTYVITSTGECVIEDVKSPATRKLAVYRLKAKLVWALYGLKIREIIP